LAGHLFFVKLFLRRTRVRFDYIFSFYPIVDLSVLLLVGRQHWRKLQR